MYIFGGCDLVINYNDLHRFHLFFETSYLESISIGIAVVVVILIAALIGTFVPMLLDKKGVDPAVATGPFITTSNDVFGILVYFLIAKIILGF